VTATSLGVTRTATGTLVVTDGVAPVTSLNPSLIAGGTIGSSVAIRTTWKATDASGIAWFGAVRKDDVSTWATQPLDAAAVLAALARGGFTLGILSNWPLAVTIDRYVEAQGWDRWIPRDRIVVSQRVGVIKPHPAIFAAAAAALGSRAPGRILHVGDDWAADVAGAAAARWRTALVTERPPDTPLPTSERDPAGEVDLVIERVTDLEAHLGWVGPAPATATR
jgi:FMN phosphatase YigB (HAD superfamily)